VVFEEFDDLEKKGNQARHDEHEVFGAIPVQHEDDGAINSISV